MLWHNKMPSVGRVLRLSLFMLMMSGPADDTPPPSAYFHFSSFLSPRNWRGFFMTEGDFVVSGGFPQRLQPRLDFKGLVLQKWSPPSWTASTQTLQSFRESTAVELMRGLSSHCSLCLLVFLGGRFFFLRQELGSKLKVKWNLSVKLGHQLFQLALKMSLLLQYVLMKEIFLHGHLLTHSLLLSLQVIYNTPAILCCDNIILDLLVKLTLKGQLFSPQPGAQLCCKCLLAEFMYRFQVLVFFSKDCPLLELLLQLTLKGASLQF